MAQFIVEKVELPIPNQQTPRGFSFWFGSPIKRRIEKLEGIAERFSSEDRQKWKRAKDAVSKLKRRQSEMKSKALALVADRCRLIGCDQRHRSPNRRNLNPGKTRRYRQLFCRSHAGLRNQISKAFWRKMLTDETLGLRRAA